MNRRRTKSVGFDFIVGGLDRGSICPSRWSLPETSPDFDPLLWDQSLDFSALPSRTPEADGSFVDREVYLLDNANISTLGEKLPSFCQEPEHLLALDKSKPPQDSPLSSIGIDDIFDSTVTEALAEYTPTQVPTISNVASSPWEASSEAEDLYCEALHTMQRQWRQENEVLTTPMSPNMATELERLRLRDHTKVHRCVRGRYDIITIPRWLTFSTAAFQGYDG